MKPARLCSVSHTAGKSQEWMVKHFHNHVTPNIWPHSAQDLNPMVYYVQSVTWRETNNYTEGCYGKHE